MNVLTGSRSDQIKKVLEDEIVTRKIIPGTRLDEVKLAERFGVSRTPIREVLKQLAMSGLIELKPHRSAVVRILDLEEIMEMFETMAEMKAVCARLAVRRMSAEEHQKLKEMHAACGEAAQQGNPDIYYRRNAEFHEVIYQGCHNEFFANEIRRFEFRLQGYIRHQLRTLNRIRSSYQEHEQIVACISEGEDRKAEEVVRDHVMIQGTRFTDFLATLKQEKKASNGN